MAIERNTFLEVLKDAYSAYYTLTNADEAEAPLSFRAVYRSREEQYLLVRSANIWSNEKNEYCYIFSAESFSAADVEKWTDWALQDMLPRVKPHREHQCTNAKVIFVADTLPDEAICAVRKKRFSKSYGIFSRHGYTELLTAAVELSRGKAFSNRAGRELLKFFSKLFALRREKA